MSAKVLGMDLGQINSTFALVDSKTEKLLKWCLIPIVENNKQTNEVICTKLKKSMDKINILEKVPGYGPEQQNASVVIELQPRCNGKTVLMAGQAQMYFVIQKELNNENTDHIDKIIGYHASNKLKYYEPMEGDPPIKTDYKDPHYRNKQIAKQHCAILLKRKGELEWLDFYNKCKKKDDLADAYLMALAYIKFVIKKEKKTGINYPIEDTDATDAKYDKNVEKDAEPAGPAVKKKKKSKKMTKKTIPTPAESAESAEVKDPKETKVKIKSFVQYSDLKPGSEIPNKPGYIMGLKKLPVKADGKIGLEVLKILSQTTQVS